MPWFNLLGKGGIRTTVESVDSASSGLRSREGSIGRRRTLDTTRTQGPRHPRVSPDAEDGRPSRVCPTDSEDERREAGREVVRGPSVTQVTR